MGFLEKVFSQKPANHTTETLAWVHDLKGMDDISIIEHATRQLNADCKKNYFQDDRYLEAFFLIDEKIHGTVEKITAQYLNIDKLSIELEERIANAIFLYHRQLYLIYISLIESLVPFQPKSLTIMLTRAIYNATQMIKCRYYSHQSAPVDVWRQISKLYLIGEKHALLEQPVQIYKDHEISTLSSAYIQACMLGSLERLSFKHQQIELISKMLALWTPRILIQNEYDEKRHLFYVDINCDAPARRIRNFKPADSCRYWCVDSINAKIELCLSLIEFKISPKQQAMKALVSNKYALATLETLRTEWSRVKYKRQRRRYDRIKTTKTATTVYGFEDTCTYITQLANTQVRRGERSYQGGQSFDERLASHYVTNSYTEPSVIYMDLAAGQSNIVDESSHGIGLYIARPANQVSLGMMICVSAKNRKDNARVGIIRSIKPMIGNELHIGVEVLSKSAVCVEAKNMRLIPTQSSSTSKSINNHRFSDTGNLSREGSADPISFTSDASSFTCLYLPQESGIAKQESLIVPKLHYNKNDTYKVNILGVNTMIKLTETLEHHENWLRVSYTQDNEKKLAA